MQTDGKLILLESLRWAMRFYDLKTDSMADVDWLKTIYVETDVQMFKL